MSRPKTAGERNESIMVEKAKKAMEKTKDPVEKLRFVLAFLKKMSFKKPFPNLAKPTGASA